MLNFKATPFLWDPLSVLQSNMIYCLINFNECISPSASINKKYNPGFKELTSKVFSDPNLDHASIFFPMALYTLILISDFIKVPVSTFISCPTGLG
jgi:hypothetical protein